MLSSLLLTKIPMNYHRIRVSLNAAKEIGFNVFHL